MYYEITEIGWEYLEKMIMEGRKALGKVVITGNQI